MAKSKRVDKITFETETCAGCGTCEMACSFHHKKVFQPSISSLVIKNRPREFGFDAILYRESAEGHIGCDFCKGLPVPMCVQSCPSTLRDELDNLLKMGRD